MSSDSRRRLAAAGLVVGVLVTTWVLRPARTPAITDRRSQTVPGSIATLEPVRIGGMVQWTLIRGRDVSNPILLWLHGGPGAAEMPVVPHYDSALERNFVVVSWDQRGAGKSDPLGFDASTMTFERFVEDGHQMTRYLQRRFGRKKIYLLGHSWGSQLGLALVTRWPEDYWAYIGVGQFVSAARGQAAAHAWLEERLREEGDRDRLDVLRTLGRPPYGDRDAYLRFISMVDHAGGDLDVRPLSLALVALDAPQYSAADLVAWLRGANRGSGPMWHEPAYQDFDAVRDAPRLEVPAYFIQGARDYVTPLSVTRDYVKGVEDPAGKTLIVFDGSAHAPFLANPERFARELVRVKEQTWRR